MQVTMSWAKTNDKEKQIVREGKTNDKDKQTVREGILIKQAKRQHVESDHSMC